MKHRLPMLRTQFTHQTVSCIASNIALVCLSVFLFTAFVAIGSGLAVAPNTGDHAEIETPSDRRSSLAAAKQPSEATHTLIIRAGNGTGKYIVTATGNVTVANVESSEIVQLPVVQGGVGEGGDNVDVIRYTGHITSFKHRGDIHATLDGRLVKPAVLDANYIQLSSQANGTTRYHLTGSGTIIPGGDAERSDYTPKNRSQVDGHVSSNDSTDSFYYTGQLTSGEASNNLSVVVNGQLVAVYKDGSRSTTAVSSTPPTDTTDTGTATATDGREISVPDSQSSPVTSEETSGETAGNGGLSLFEIVGGVILMGLVAIGGLVLLSR